VKVNVADDSPPLLKSDPGRDVGVVVEARDNDLVARQQRAPNGPAEIEGQTGHIGAKDDFVWSWGVEQISHGQTSFSHRLVHTPAGQERTVDIAIGLDKGASHCLDNWARHLGTAWTVQENQWLAILSKLECREFGTQQSNSMII
jgi:hypothetical protein